MAFDPQHRVLDEALAELTARRVVEPLREELSRLGARMEAVAHEVLGGNGSPSLRSAIVDLVTREECRYSREQMRAELLRLAADDQRETREAVTFRERLRGALIFAGSLCGAGTVIWRIAQEVMHHS